MTLRTKPVSERRERQHQQHLRGLYGEIEDHGHIASTEEQADERDEHEAEIVADGEKLQAVQLFGGDGSTAARDRRVERVPDQVAKLAPRAAPAAHVARRRHVDASRARGTASVPNTRRIGWAKLDALYCVRGRGSG